MTSLDKNQIKNKNHYEDLYSDFSIKSILWKLNNLESYLDDAIATDTSWNALYQKDLRNRLKGKKVLEMGCGDCTNAAIMSALGAEVYANDIADASGLIINKLNEQYNFRFPIKFIKGDFLKNDLKAKQFDFVIGKAFLHHLTIPIEKKFLQETAKLLKKDGEARFFEPAVNNKFLDFIRWYIPVPGRPSKFRKNSFKEWKLKDPHPDRSFSSNHWELVGREFFKQVEIITIGSLERFSRIIKKKENKWKFRRWAFKSEKKLPKTINRSFSRSQLIIYKNPI
ncbi:class I SAM-dependent methyltransferase [Gramella lutea]|uniref:Class I SAM-dependent methyltransferase n=1 Tax=Christiangramia lutea TaxID=1607951 RepID=A0A9X1V094_9FLAO|nr:class I SAM-dependent methyltransferase [Christiangramia lutea]MCH4821596.1 class I SAM-dependent methyltransferase [Christiangramia lutea]